MQVLLYSICITLTFFTSNNVATSRPSDVWSSRELSETPDKLNCKLSSVVPFLKPNTHQTFAFPWYTLLNIYNFQPLVIMLWEAYYTNTCLTPLQDSAEVLSGLQSKLEELKRKMSPRPNPPETAHQMSCVSGSGLLLATVNLQQSRDFPTIANLKSFQEVHYRNICQCMYISNY